MTNFRNSVCAAKFRILENNGNKLVIWLTPRNLSKFRQRNELEVYLTIDQVALNKLGIYRIVGRIGEDTLKCNGLSMRRYELERVD